MISTLMLLHVLQQPRTVTLTHPCAHSSVVLEALGKELGVKMAPSGSVLEDYIFVRFKYSTKEQVMERLASALGARWLAKGDTLYLDRTPTMDAELDEAFHKMYREWLPGALDSLEVAGEYDRKAAMKLVGRAVQASKNLGNNWEEVRAISQASPVARFLRSFLKGLGTERIMAQTFRESVTYTNQPRNGEQPFPRDLSSVVDRYEREVAAHMDALRAFGVDASLPGFQGFSFADVPSVIKISVSRDPTALNATIEVSVGELFLHASLESLSFQPKQADLDLSADATFVLRPEIQEMLLALRRSYDTGARQDKRTVSPALSGLLRSMPAFEPLTDSATPAFEKIAEMCGKDVVAIVSDEAAMFPYWISEAPAQNLKQFIDEMVARGAIIDDSLGYLRIVPSLPSRTRAMRVDRNSVAEFYRHWDQQGRVTLDGLAILIEPCVEDGSVNALGYMASVALGNIGADGKSLMSAITGVRTLAVYSSLTAQVRKSLKSGWKEAQFHELSPTTQGRVLSMMRVNPVGFSTNGRWMNEEWGMSFVLPKLGDPDTRTESKNGLPRGTRVAMRVSDELKIEPRQKDPEVRVRGVDDFDAIVRMHVLDRQEGGTNLYLDYSVFNVRPTERLNIVITLPDGRSVRYFAQLSADPAGGRPLAPSEFPEPLKSKFAEALKKIGGNQ